MQASLIRRTVRSAGFTLIELVLVLTIISVLVGAGIYMMMGNVEVAKETRVETDIKTLMTQLKLYEARNAVPPTTEQGLDALVSRPDKEPVPDRWSQLLEEPLVDPWKRPYKYEFPAKRSKRAYDIYSLGADGVESDDDIGNWKRAKTKDA